MYEYEIIRLGRRKEKKTRELTNKKGKVEIQEYTEIETLEEFDARVKKTLNDLAAEGWQIVNVNYNLPIQGNRDCIVGTIWVGHSTTDFNSAEFVAVLQRTK